ncbi:MAG: hypothetical protein EPO02_02310 [Nitrospirae bacterium]|nr:MAG: hypothetical protein EPO02_02310 [Nitrospirota bacterium]
MPENIWNPWRMMALGLLLVGATVLVTTLVMGYRGVPWELAPSRSLMHSNGPVRAVAVPNQIDVGECNASARHRTWSSMAAGSEYESAYRFCMHQKGY